MMQNDYLEHHGILGMKWGVRRYQNSDGSLTPAGAKRLQQYKKRQSESASNIGYNQYAQNKNISKRYAIAADRAKSKGNTDKYNKFSQKSKNFEKIAKQYEVSTKKQLNKIKNMSYDEMVSEKNAVRLRKGADAVTKVLLTAALMPTGTIYISLDNNDYVTYNYRNKQLSGQKR